jgi:hypothetical protein
MKAMEEKEGSLETHLMRLDGPVAAPEHHKVIFENERVRVVELRVGPGDKVRRRGKLKV